MFRAIFPAFDGRSGRFTAVPPSLERTRRGASAYPNWWIDNPDAALAEGMHPGAKSVKRGRESFLRDFAERMSLLPRNSSVERTRL